MRERTAKRSARYLTLREIAAEVAADRISLAAAYEELGRRKALGALLNPDEPAPP